MDHDMEQLSTSWDEATRRVEAYLTAHRVAPRENLIRHVLAIVDAAREQHAPGTTTSPVETAMAIATERTDRWFAGLSGAPDNDPQASSRGRLAYFVSGCAERWPGTFLSEDPPPAMLEALRAKVVQAGPAMEFRSLIRREVDYGPMEDIARETWGQFSWGHVLRAFALWVVIFFAALGIYLRFFE
jgi:hypothetical protein